MAGGQIGHILTDRFAPKGQTRHPPYRGVLSCPGFGGRNLTDEFQSALEHVRVIVLDEKIHLQGGAMI